MTSFYYGLITTLLRCSFYGPSDLESCFMGLVWLTLLELELRCTGFLSQALNASRNVGVHLMFLSAPLFSLVGLSLCWMTDSHILFLGECPHCFFHYVILYSPCSVTGINEERFHALPLLCSPLCLADLGCLQRGRFLPKTLFKIPLPQWCVKNSQKCWKTFDVWDSFQGIYLDPRGPQSVRGKKKGGLTSGQRRAEREATGICSGSVWACLAVRVLGASTTMVVPVHIFAEGLRKIFQSQLINQ